MSTETPRVQRHLVTDPVAHGKFIPPPIAQINTRAYEPGYIVTGPVTHGKKPRTPDI